MRSPSSLIIDRATSLRRLGPARTGVLPRGGVAVAERKASLIALKIRMQPSQIRYRSWAPRAQGSLATTAASRAAARRRVRFGMAGLSVARASLND